MITYKYIDRDMIWAKVVDDTKESNELVNSQTNQTYLQWVSEGNEPEPADPIPEPVELTPQEKLASAGLSVDELKVLLGIA